MSDARDSDGDADVLVGSVDQGPSSTRFVISNRAGETVSSAQMAVDSKHPQPG